MANCYNNSGWRSQTQDQDQDQRLRTIIRDTGNSNVTVTVDNENILVAVLVLVDALNGALDTGALRTYLEMRANSAQSASNVQNETLEQTENK